MSFPGARPNQPAVSTRRGNAIPLGPSGGSSGNSGASSNSASGTNSLNSLNGSNGPYGSNGSNGPSGLSSTGNGGRSKNTGVSSGSSASSASSSNFRTDTDISRKTTPGVRERNLERWVDDSGPPTESLQEILDFSKGSSGHWDQFAANKEKFGVVSTYNELYYTTAIDKSHPKFAERERKAHKIAKEIESSGHDGNVHIAEERGLVVDDSGLDEEDKYSGVQRANGFISSEVRKALSKPSYLDENEKLLRAKDNKADNRQTGKSSSSGSPSASAKQSSSPDPSAHGDGEAKTKAKPKFKFNAAKAHAATFQPTPMFVPGPAMAAMPAMPTVPGMPLPPFTGFTPGMSPAMSPGLSGVHPSHMPAPFIPSAPSPGSLASSGVSSMSPPISGANKPFNNDEKAKRRMSQSQNRRNDKPEIARDSAAEKPELKSLSSTDFDFFATLAANDQTPPRPFVTEPRWGSAPGSYRDFFKADSERRQPIRYNMYMMPGPVY